MHVPERGWVTLEEALRWQGEPAGTVSVNWGWGPKVADQPVAVMKSNEADRLLAMTWGASTCTLVGNEHHPCIHADPYMPDLAPGVTASIEGELIFFEGGISEFDDWWQARS